MVGAVWAYVLAILLVFGMQRTVDFAVASPRVRDASIFALVAVIGKCHYEHSDNGLNAHLKRFTYPTVAAG